VLEKVESMKEVQKFLRSELEKSQSQVSDQERHKKMIRDSIDVLETQNAVTELNANNERLQEELDSIGGSDAA
jgi:hypothetical protein